MNHLQNWHQLAMVVSSVASNMLFALPSMAAPNTVVCPVNKIADAPGSPPNCSTQWAEDVDNDGEHDHKGHFGYCIGYVAAFSPSGTKVIIQRDAGFTDDVEISCEWQLPPQSLEVVLTDLVLKPKTPSVSAKTILSTVFAGSTTLRTEATEFASGVSGWRALYLGGADVLDASNSVFRGFSPFGAVLSEAQNEIRVADSTFELNSSGGSGAAIDCPVPGSQRNCTDVTIERCLFRDNTVQTTSSLQHRGGAVNIFGAENVFIGFSEFVNNGITGVPAVIASGGALSISSVFTLEIFNSVFTGNFIYSSPGRGGGLAIDTADMISPVQITGTKVWGNTAPDEGGGIWLFSVGPAKGYADISYTDIFDNTTYGPSSTGGGLSAVNSGLNVSHGLISGNSSAFGGGVWLSNSAVELDRMGVNENSASVAGGLGLLNGSAEATRSSLSYNTSLNGGGAIHLLGGALSLRWVSLIENASPGATMWIAPNSGNDASVDAFESVVSSLGTDCSISGAPTIVDSYALSTDGTCGFTGPGSLNSATVSSYAATDALVPAQLD